MSISSAENEVWIPKLIEKPPTEKPCAMWPLMQDNPKLLDTHDKKKLTWTWQAFEIGNALVLHVGSVPWVIEKLSKARLLDEKADFCLRGDYVVPYLIKGAIYWLEKRKIMRKDGWTISSWIWDFLTTTHKQNCGSLDDLKRTISYH